MAPADQQRPPAARAATAEPPLRIGVSGGAAADAGTLAIATALGAALARHDAVLICGGLGGVMAACCHGAREAGGLTVGILPGARPGDANRWVMLPVVTDLGHARNVVLVHTVEALIAVGGSYGTLSEVALALKIGVPVAALASWVPRRAGHPEPPIAIVQTVDEAAGWALEAAAERRRRQQREIAG